MSIIIVAGVDYSGIPAAEVFAHLAAVQDEKREERRLDREGVVR